MNTKNLHQNVIGVDVAKNKLDIYQSHSGELQQIANKEESIEKFVRAIKKSGTSTLVVMEGTGGYESLLAETLLDSLVDCVVANPRQVRDFICGCGKIEKKTIRSMPHTWPSSDRW